MSFIWIYYFGLSTFSEQEARLVFPKDGLITRKSYEEKTHKIYLFYLGDSHLIV